ncbi:hypothetical protein [Streptomyces sp. NPDC059349]|uniref:hypothetical protein n=1 Tax=Streptomyces sp. NPDC059349 TaxID=3346808 RepID=UPI003691636E
MHRVDLTRPAETALAAMPDDVHEETLAFIDGIADEGTDGAGRMTMVDAVLCGKVWVVWVALGVLITVLDAGRIA